MLKHHCLQPMDADEYCILTQFLGHNLGYTSFEEFHEAILFFKVDLNRNVILKVDFAADRHMSDEKWDGLEYSFFLQDLIRRNYISDNVICQEFFDLKNIQAHLAKQNTYFEQKYVTMDGERTTHRIALAEIRIAENEKTISFAIVNIDQYETKLHEMTMNAQVDFLTGVFNRRGLDARVENYLRISKDRRFAFVSMDIDDFKRVNDLYGHAIGDDILITLANNMRDVFGKNALVARMGGDEFVALLQDTSKEESLRLIETFSKMKHCFKKFDKLVEFTVSIGVSFYPETSREYAELSRQADLALYAAKIKGKNTYRIYSSIMETLSRSQLGFSLTDLINGFPGAIIIYKNNGRGDILFANNLMAKICECENTDDFFEFTNRSFAQMVHPDDRSRVLDAIASQIEKSDNLCFDCITYRIKTKLGNVKRIFDAGHLVHNEHFGDIFFVYLLDEEFKEQLLQS